LPFFEALGGLDDDADEAEGTAKENPDAFPPSPPAPPSPPSPLDHKFSLSKRPGD